MKIAFLVESTDNLTANSLINALHDSGHEIHILPYCQNGHDECSIVSTEKGLALSLANNIIQPADFDGALLWCWGTAQQGRQYLRLFENSQVKVLNSTHDTEVTDSKINIANLLSKANVPTPKTICVQTHSSQANFTELQKNLGPPPYVFKPDYGTRGIGVQFALSLSDVKRLADQLKTQQSQQGFVLQKFIGNPDKLISHYRALVIGGNVFPTVMKVTSKSPLKTSNIFSGGKVEFIHANESLTKIALMATKASGLNVAGVDIMKSNEQGSSHYWVLEVNDGPGTKTFEKAGFNVSKSIIDYFIKSLSHSKD